MSLSKIKVPLYDSTGYDKRYKLIVDEFAGRIVLTICKKTKTFPFKFERVAFIQCSKDDLDRAWNAVKKC